LKSAARASGRFTLVCLPEAATVGYSEPREFPFQDQPARCLGRWWPRMVGPEEFRRCPVGSSGRTGAGNEARRPLHSLPTFLALRPESKSCSDPIFFHPGTASGQPFSRGLYLGIAAPPARRQRPHHSGAAAFSRTIACSRHDPGASSRRGL